MYSFKTSILSFYSFIVYLFIQISWLFYSYLYSLVSAMTFNPKNPETGLSLCRFHWWSYVYNLLLSDIFGLLLLFQVWFTFIYFLAKCVFVIRLHTTWITNCVKKDCLPDIIPKLTGINSTFIYNWRRASSWGLDIKQIWKLVAKKTFSS